MNIREQHIEVSMATQNIASNTRRKLLPDEIDWLLNKNLERFIQSKLKSKGNGAFQVDQLDADSIRTLLVTNRTIPVTDSFDSDVYVASLPGDYSYLISDDSRTLSQCGTPRPTLKTITESVLSLPLYSSKSTPKYFSTVVITLNGNTISLLDIITAQQITGYTGLNSKEERYLIRDVMLWHMRNTLGIIVYWENYKSVYKPHSFIFPGGTIGTITVDDTTTVNGIVTSLSYNRYSSILGTWQANRLTPADKISTMRRTAFIKSSNLSPISEVSGRELTVYGDTGFIVTGVSIDYVKKPRRISLLLSQDCELPEEFHQAICDLTVEYFKAMIADPNWETKLKDNMTRSVPI
jgi:hypothetical protein